MPLSIDLVAALVVFALASSISPGPNNALLLASGLNFGFRRSLPHIMGSVITLAAMTVLIGLGLAQFIERAPAALTAIKAGGAAYILWLAYKLASTGSSAVETAGGRSQPLSFLAAATLQSINPKGWVMSTSAIATFARPDALTASIVLIALILGAVSLPSLSVWALCGVTLRRVLSEPRIVRRFNIVMAVLVVASLWPLVHDFGRR